MRSLGNSKVPDAIGVNDVARRISPSCQGGLGCKNRLRQASWRTSSSSGLIELWARLTSVRCNIPPIEMQSGPRCVLLIAGAAAEPHFAQAHWNSWAEHLPLDTRPEPNHRKFQVPSTRENYGAHREGHGEASASSPRIRSNASRFSPQRRHRSAPNPTTSIR